MADQRIQYTEEMVGAGHATKADTLNRLALKYLNNDGSPIIGNTRVSIKTSNNGADAAHDIDFSAGGCFDSLLTEPMVLASILVKQIDAVWAVGTNAGGIDTGAVAASTLYAVWLIKRTDTGVVDALFSLSFTAPTMPGSYDKKRLIGFVVTDGSSNILAFTQSGDYFRLMGDVVQDVNDATMTNNVFETGTLSVPPNCVAHIYGYLTNSGSTSENDGKLWVRTKGAADTVSNQEAWHVNISSSVAFRQGGSVGQIFADGSSQIEYTCAEGGGTAIVQINTFGCLMLTRSNP